MKIGPNDSKIVDIFSAITMLENYKLTILRDNGWVLDEYDDMLKNNGRMVARHDAEQIIDKYIKVLNEKLTEHNEVDIFKIIYFILGDLSRV